MSIAAVCCPGPSLPITWSRRHDSYHAGVWAVNAGLIAVPEADWLSAGDAISYERLVGELRPRVGAIAMPDVVADISARPGWAGIRWLSWFDLAWYGEHQVRKHVNWSVQIALLHAGEHAHHIDLYGADCRGTVDCTGTVAEDNRSLERWKREEDDLSTTIALLAEHGVTVNRIQP